MELMALRENEITDVARDFCELVDRADEEDSSWLHQMAALLPRLHIAAEALGRSEHVVSHLITPDLDDCFGLFLRLRELLGPRDAYWMVFDVADDGHGMSGSLADDLADIYSELKYGLHIMDAEPVQVLDLWRSGYRMHWGQHLVDAVRHLYELGARGQL